MLPPLFVILVLILPQYVQSSCCRLPFTDRECEVNRQGPHRYRIMPDRRSGIIRESTECYINDFDSNYRKVIEKKNSCNDCPGLLVLHTNSSEIFLFPEYLERIVEGRTAIQRKNVVILTTGLVGAYDLDFTFFSRYYATRRVEDVPSFYVDLQMPVFDSKLSLQPTLRLRLPNYNEDREGVSKISREELMNPFTIGGQSMVNPHQLPYLYHFDIARHRHPPDQCTLYDVHVGSSELNWKILDSEPATCHTFMPYFGLNKCFATGFTRLFCPIEEHVSKDDRLQLSPYLRTTNRVEHLTLAVTGGRHIDISLNNGQLRPAEQVKVLLLLGHLVVTDINTDLPIRVEYGWDCKDFSLAVPAGFSATRYRRFDGKDLSIFEGNNVVNLPSCFRVIPNPNAPQESKIEVTTTPHAERESHEEEVTKGNLTETQIIIDLTFSNITIDEDEKQESVIANYWNILRNEHNLPYITIGLLVLVALIPLCFAVFYRVYCTKHRRSKWTLKHGSRGSSTNDQNDVTLRSYVDNGTQTSDTPIRI